MKYSENITKHRSRLRNTRRCMIDRCYNKNHIHFKYYGGKGITICEEWLTSLDAFQNWALENGYDEKLTIDRTDSSKGYSPENCTWKSRSYQSQTANKHKSNTSGFIGVNMHASGKYRAYICVNSKIRHLGLFTKKIDAAKAYDNYINENSLNHLKNF